MTLSKPKASKPIIIVDSREQLPLFEIGKDEHIIKTLETGDYSLLGYETEFTIERKSVPDAIKSVLSDRVRFQAEMERAKSLKRFAIVIEGTIDDIKNEIKKQWVINNNTQALKNKNRFFLISNLSSVINTYLHWSVQYSYPVFFCKDRAEAKRVVKELLIAYDKYKKRGVL